MFDDDKYNKIVRVLNFEGEVRSNFGIEGDPNYTEIKKLYSKAIISAIRLFGLENEFKISGIEEDLADDAEDDACTKALALINDVRIEKLLIEAESEGSDQIVLLDDDWRSKVQSYIEHIIIIVRKASIEEGIRERIMNRIAQLSAEVERNRTNITRLAEIWIELTAAGGRGAENLKPAVELLGRLAKAMTKLRDSVTRPALPSPDQAQLPPPEDIDVE